MAHIVVAYIVMGYIVMAYIATTSIPILTPRGALKIDFSFEGLTKRCRLGFFLLEGRAGLDNVVLIDFCVAK